MIVVMAVMMVATMGGARVGVWKRATSTASAPA
jgi:hypothetical protein